VTKLRTVSWHDADESAQGLPRPPLQGEEHHLTRGPEAGEGQLICLKVGAYFQILQFHDHF
jgi:hypothetical protein